MKEGLSNVEDTLSYIKFPIWKHNKFRFLRISKRLNELLVLFTKYQHIPDTVKKAIKHKK